MKIDIKELRESMGLTQAQMADQLEVARNTIANWETRGFSSTAQDAILYRLFTSEAEKARVHRRVYKTVEEGVGKQKKELIEKIEKLQAQLARLG